MLLVVLYYYLFFFIYWRNKNVKDVNFARLKQLVIIAFLLLFIFFGFRNITVLCDTPHYYSSLRDKIEIRNSISWYFFNLTYRFEPGYQIFESIHAKLFKNPYSIIISSAFIISVGNICFYKKMNKSGLFLCLFLLLNYQLQNQYSAIRQGIATIIMYYAIINMIEGNFIKYIVASMLACTFHITAVVSFLLYPLKYIKFNKKNMVLFIVAFFVITTSLLKPLIEMFATDSLYADTNADRESFPIGSAILFSMSAFLFLRARRYFTRFKAIEVNNTLWLICCICLLLQAIDIVFPIVGRVAMYFVPFLISVFVSCLRSIPDVNYRNNQTIVIFFIFFGWFIIYNALKPEWYYLYPYSFMDFDKIFTGYEIDR